MTPVVHVSRLIGKYLARHLTIDVGFSPDSAMIMQGHHGRRRCTRAGLLVRAAGIERTRLVRGLESVASGRVDHKQGAKRAVKGGWS